MKEKQMTLWTRPDEVLKSQYGKVTYREWCEREIQRIASTGGNARLVERPDGYVALFR